MLDVNENASDQEIKNAYRKLAIKWHPDKNQQSKEAELKFVEISNAYAILKDSSKRYWYDFRLREARGEKEEY